MSSNLIKLSYILLVCIVCLSCSKDESSSVEALDGPLFSLLPPAHTKVSFRNSVQESNEFNFINYVYIYNGGGVALGDINKDGLLDIYLSSNQGSNKLYLNKGKMVFEDITSSSGTSDSKGWSTGVSMVDINNDGWLDIYVCKSGSTRSSENRQNKLFVNQGENKFVEASAIFGLNDPAYSTQSYFLDYDKDGDLDMYLVNHRADFSNNSVMSAQIQRAIVPEFSDKLYRNDGRKFTDVSASAGIINKNWGLSASIADYNDDGWPDIYVCNDFTEPDHLWINNQKGGFTDEVLSYMDHISYYSMGSDVADFNNDGQEDLIVLDMVSEDHKRSKQNMAAMSSDQFNTMVDNNYHHQYMANMLQLNRGDGQFSEIAHLAGVSKTDWSWAPLFADLDNDGLKDLFITNGIKRDMTDNDYKINLRERGAQGQMTINEVFDLVPSVKLANYAFKNSGNIRFNNASTDWGFTDKLNSNGAAYGDLDNDGDLDLVVNNLEDFCSIYKNNSNTNFLKVKLEGPKSNPLGISTKLELSSANSTQYYEHYLNRGYQSSMGQDIIFGLGSGSTVSTLRIIWPDGKSQELRDISANKTIKINYADARFQEADSNSKKGYVSKVNGIESILDYQHVENDYDDFIDEILLPHKMSTTGPSIATSDINGDGMDDLFIGGAKGMSPSFYLQNSDASFTRINISLCEREKRYEDINAHFFDADGDSDQDLYVVSGGNEFKANEQVLQDRLYLNNGKGIFKKSNNALPKFLSSGSVVKSADYDSDGDLDLLVCSRIIPGKYPLPASSYLLENKNGRFVDVTESLAPGLKEIGLVTDALFSDYDGDQDLDILLVGEWMPLTILNNDGDSFSKTDESFGSGTGWWYAMNSFDVDGDGDEDYVLGNLGLNNKFGAQEDKPFHVFCDDFDGTGNLDIVLSKESEGQLLPVRGRECSSQQMPFIKEKFPTFKSFANADLPAIYGEEKLSDAIHYTATNFESVLMINDGSGQLTRKALPIEAQMGPTLDIEFEDINRDGIIDIVAAGSIYNTEVETVRYDASKGYILLGDGSGEFKYAPDSGFVADGNIKDLQIVSINKKKHIALVENNGPLQLFLID